MFVGFKVFVVGLRFQTPFYIPFYTLNGVKRCCSHLDRSLSNGIRTE